MTIADGPQVQASRAERVRLPRASRLGEFTLPPRRVLRPHRRGRPAATSCRVDAFLRALQRDVAWDFFYGIVNFDGVFGTVNHYGTVDLFAGRYNDAYRKAELDHLENFETPLIRATFKAMLDDWTNDGLRPVRQPDRDRRAVRHQERRQPGRDHPPPRHRAAHGRRARATSRSAPTTTATRSTASSPTSPRTSRRSTPSPASRTRWQRSTCSPTCRARDVTWNPSVVSVCKDSLYCPTTEEYILPIIHGNDRVEWFVQLSDEIHWDVEDRDTGAARAKVVMRPATWPRCRPTSATRATRPKRSMLLVWENAAPELPALISSGKLPSTAVQI